jgi:four helix bundle protein
MESMQTFEGLECWKAARQLRLFISREVIATFPRDERYELIAQLRRAARSVTANIAEGYGRYHFRDNYKFCSNARGSLFEVLDHLITANDEGYLRDELLEKGRSLFLTAKQLLNGYMSYLSRAAEGSSVLREDAPEPASHDFHPLNS